MKYLIILGLFVSCQTNAEPSKYKMKCEEVASDRFRCENIEVVCYTSKGSYGLSALQCKFKE